MTKDARHHRLYWRSRRGMLELEFRLLPFVDEVYPTLDAQERDAYETLLSYEDWQIFDWLQGRDQPDPALAGIVARIQKHGQ